MDVQVAHEAERCASGAAHFFSELKRIGIDSIYFNAGTDFAPLVEAYAAEDSHDVFPFPVLAAHENVVVGMAHGAFLVTGRPQALMVHVSVGTANTVCGIMNAARERVPLVVLAGRSPILESGAEGARDTSIHWPQEMFDQAGMVRELVKWDYELRRPDHAVAVARRAVSVAMEEPRGPVYLSLPRETLAATSSAGPDAGLDPALAQSSPPTVDAAAVAEVARLVADAVNPVIVVTSAGADVSVPPLLEELASKHNLGVAQANPRYLNLRWDHPHNLGTLDEVLERSAPDLFIFVECDVPWISARAEPSGEAKIVQVGLDPLSVRYPMRTHRADRVVNGTAHSFLTEFDKALSTSAGGTPRRPPSGTPPPTQDESEAPIESVITKFMVSRVLGALLDEHDAVFNEYWADPNLLRRSKPGTYFSLPAAGGLGWALPAALGARHALGAGQVVVATVGDGAYMFSNPAACHHAAAKHDLPILVVIANNSRWEAVASSTSRVYPSGQAVARDEARFSDLSPSPDYAALCESFGGRGYRVDKAEDLADVLREAVNTVRTEGRQVVVDVRCR